MATVASALVPVTVAIGFLGAGKTTLVNRWLAEASRGDVAVVVNELGEIGVDGALLAVRVSELRQRMERCARARRSITVVDATRTGALPAHDLAIGFRGRGPTRVHLLRTNQQTHRIRSRRRLRPPSVSFLGQSAPGTQPTPRG